MALTTVNSDGVKDDSIKNIDVKSDAAIAGTKISPNFGSQNIVTTGLIEVASTSCHIDLMETSTTNHRIRNGSGNFHIQRISDDKNTTETQLLIDGGTGAVELHYDGDNKKLETTSTGVNITDGELRIGDASGGNDALIRLGATGTDVDTHGVIAYDKSDNYLSLVVAGESHGGGGIKINNGGQVCIGTTAGPGEVGLYLGDGTNPAGHIYANGSDHLYVLANAYYNSGWKYQGSGHAGSLTIGYGDLVFNTATAGSAGNAITWAEVFRAKNSNGDLSITNGNLNVANSKGITALGVDNSTYAELDITVAAADGSGSNNVATFKRGTSNSVINLAFPNGGGIDFGATGGPTNSATGTSEILADYEEGNWTPVPTAGTFSTAIRKYTRIGRLVFCSFEVVHDDGGGNYLQINGLPFSNLAQHGANLGTVGYQTGGISPVFTSVTTGTSI